MIWWVIYDVASPKRLKKIAKLCQAAGLRRIQKSVFAGTLSQEKVIELREALLEGTRAEEDQVLMFPVSMREMKAAISLGNSEKLEELLHPPAFLVI